MRHNALKTWKNVLPSSLRRWLRLRFGWRWFRGDYRSWAAARSASGGYEDAKILNRVLAAARTSRDGQAAWDRDGVAFLEPQLHAPLVDALRACAIAEGGRLRVVDFGGGLGGTWRQNRGGLKDLRDIRWCVVEQPHFVEIGEREFTSDVLSFHSTLADACEEFKATVILFSSVLQYLPAPHELLSEAVDRGCRNLIIDRTSFWNGGRDRLTVQFTPPELGGGSYPCWLFHRPGVDALLASTHFCASEWPGFDDVDRRVHFRGMHFARKFRC